MRDVQPTLGARMRLPATGASNKNDPDDALSVTVAAQRMSRATLDCQLGICAGMG